MTTGSTARAWHELDLVRLQAERDGDVVRVWLNRPEARNAMDPKSAQALFDAFQSFDADNGQG